MDNHFIHFDQDGSFFENYTYSGTSLILQDTSLIRSLSEITKVAFGYKTTSHLFNQGTLTCPKGVQTPLYYYSDACQMCSFLS